MSKRILILLLSLFMSGFAFSAESHAKSTIVADASANLGTFKNTAGGINFWGEEEAQHRFIEEIGTGLYRFKAILYEVEKESGSYTNFPWDGGFITLEQMNTLVQNLNLAMSRGGKVMVQIYGIPKWLSTSQDERVITNNMPNYAKYPLRILPNGEGLFLQQ